jgi:autotransporter-associated beta strand protein
MKRAICSFVLIALVAAGAISARAQINYSFWDGATDSPPGGNVAPAGIWENANWSTTNAASTPANANMNPTNAQSFIEGSDAHFCAGSFSTGTYTITANSNHTVGAFFLDTFGTNTLNGPGVFTFATNGEGFGVTTGGSLTISNALVCPQSAFINWTAGAGTLTLAGNANFGTVTNSLVNTPNIRFTTGGTLVLSGSNTFGGNHGFGAVNIAGTGATLVIGSDTCLGGAGNANGNVWVNFTGANETLVAQGAHTVTSASTGIMVQFHNATTIGGTDPLTIAGSCNFATALNLTVNNTADTTIAAIAGNSTTGSGPHLMGTGRLVLGGNGNFSSALVMDGGTLGIASGTALNKGITIDVGVAGAIQAMNAPQTMSQALTFNNGDCNITFAGTNTLTFSGACTLQPAGVTASITLSNTADTVFSGLVSGGATVSIYGPGRMVLSRGSGNTYTGDTQVNGGVLKAASTTGSATGTGTVQLNSGTLTGAGTAGAVAVYSGATIFPGDAPNLSTATLSTSNLTWNAGGHYEWAIGDATGTEGGSDGWDTIVVNGSLTINASLGNNFNIDLTSLTLTNTPGSTAHFNPANNYTWRILTATNGINGFSPGAFSLNTGGFSNAFAGAFSIAQNGNDLDLIYTAPPSITVSSFAVLGDKTARINVSALSGSNYVVQAATNLAPPVTWSNLSTNLADTNGAFQYIDTGATNFRQRFYRISTP